MIIRTETIQAVREIDSIQEVISDYVQLKKKGKNYLGLCPFHNEKSPSFTVSPDKKLFHCFGCHESGDLISFVMKVDNLSFKEAIEQIAKRTGIEVFYQEGTNQSPKDQKLREDIFNCLQIAKDYYVEQLRNSKDVKDYVTTRGIIDETVESFGLGYAPKNNELERVLLSKGIEKNILVESGLYYQHESGQMRHRFKGRLIIPIKDHLGRTIAFGGRQLETVQNAAKYINSPETKVFNKSKLVFGLDRAKSVIRKENSVCIMEGYMDVIMAHQFGIETAVGSMGTALTQQQIQLLNRFTSKAVLCFDSDNAGQEATLRSIEELKQKSLDVNVMQLSTKDPADILLEEGKDAFNESFDNAKYYLDYLLDRWYPSVNLENIQDVSDLVSKLVPYIKLEKDGIIQSHFVSNLALKLKINRDLILAKLQKSGYIKSTKKYTPAFKNKTKYQKAEELLICACASNSNQRLMISELINENFFSDAQYQSLFSSMITKNTEGNELLSEYEENNQKILSRILVEFNERQDKVTDLECKQCVEILIDKQDQDNINVIKMKLSDTENLSEEDELQLLQKLSQLMSKGKENR